MKLKRIKRKPAGKDNRPIIISQAKELIQLSALRLEIEKREKSLKSSIDKLMSDGDYDTLEDTVVINKQKVALSVERTETKVSSIDPDKLIALLTPAQVKQCSTFTLTKAKEVLPQALVDKCTVVGEPRVSFKVKAPQGYPVPSYTLFK